MIWYVKKMNYISMSFVYKSSSTLSTWSKAFNLTLSTRHPAAILYSLIHTSRNGGGFKGDKVLEPEILVSSEILVTVVVIRNGWKESVEYDEYIHVSTPLREPPSFPNTHIHMP